LKIIIGLGNTGAQYKNSRHNIGFEVIDKISAIKGAKFIVNKKFEAEIAKINGFIFAKPLTLMNKSGQAVQEIKDYYKVSNSDIFVTSDDFNLEIGQVRFRRGGTSGGHKGLDSIIVHIGDDFYRFRIGIGKDEGMDETDYVLKKFSSGEKKLFDHIIDESADIMLKLITQDDFENKTININPPEAV